MWALIIICSCLNGDSGADEHPQKVFDAASSPTCGRHERPVLYLRVRNWPWRPVVKRNIWLGYIGRVTAVRIDDGAICPQRLKNFPREQRTIAFPGRPLHDLAGQAVVPIVVLKLGPKRQNLFQVANNPVVIEFEQPKSAMGLNPPRRPASRLPRRPQSARHPGAGVFVEIQG